MEDTSGMLVDGIAHVAVMTSDTDRLCAFYRDMFGAVVEHELRPGNGMRLSFVRVGPGSEFNVFEIEGNKEAERQTPMFGRGRLDHLALHVPSLDAFETVRDRLVAAEASDGFVTDFGPVLSLFFTDPDGLEAEVIVDNPDHVPGVFNPPGTPSPRYQAQGGSG